MRGVRRLGSLATGIALLLPGCGGEQEERQPAGGHPSKPASPSAPLVVEPFTEAEIAHILELSPLPAPPPDPTNRVADDPRAARLGQRLFYDERLSRDRDTSCATCHDPARGWSDGRALAEGILPLDRHSMTLWNVAHQRWLFWDGRADSLWAQSLVPLESPLEHAFSRLELAHVLANDATLRDEYEGLFGPLPPLAEAGRFPPVGRPVPEDDHAHKLAAEHEARAAASGGHAHGPGDHFYHPHQRAWDGMTPEDRDAVTEVFVNAGKAIAAFERRIVSSRAPFDVFVEGLREHDDAKIGALDDAARRGLKLFLGEAQCFNCHDGPLFSDREFHGLGLPPLPEGDANDPGRTRGIEVVRNSPFNAVGQWSDDPTGPARYKIELLPTHAHGGPEFRTPSLRNVAATAPYMHQGQLATLEDVVRFYSTLDGAGPRREAILARLELDATQEADLVAFLRALTDTTLDPGLTAPVPDAR